MEPGLTTQYKGGLLLVPITLDDRRTRHHLAGGIAKAWKPCVLAIILWVGVVFDEVQSLDRTKHAVPNRFVARILARDDGRGGGRRSLSRQQRSYVKGCTESSCPSANRPKVTVATTLATGRRVSFCRVLFLKKPLQMGPTCSTA